MVTSLNTETSAVRKTRWSPPGEVNILGSGLSVQAPLGLTTVQLAAYLAQVRLDEINRLLKFGTDAPIQDMVAWRQGLEGERARLIERVLKNNAEMFAATPTSSSISSPTSIPGVPSNCRFADKIYLPQRDYPEINFVGLLIGPRGNTLRRMEVESGAKISIRGKGAQKDLRMDAAMLAAADEELHAVVMADTQEKFEKAVAVINGIVERACSNPEEANELRKQQLLELQKMNGTARPEETVLCTNCGQYGHRKYECKQPAPMANRLTCHVCGGVGHVGMDCVYKDDPAMLQASAKRAEHMDEQYATFLAEIGEDKAQKQTQVQFDPSAYYMQQLHAQQQQYMFAQPGMDALPYTYASPHQQHVYQQVQQPDTIPTPPTKLNNTPWASGVQADEDASQ